MSDYDQRWIRRADVGFRSASAKHQICASCGNEPRCARPRVQSRCEVFTPVLSFADETGLYSRHAFNTFRRGLGWYRRLVRGASVRLYSTAIEDFVGDVRVVETHQGTLGSLLEQHAPMNHLFLDEPVRAEVGLLRALVRLYGRNYVLPTSLFSVIYLERR